MHYRRLGRTGIDVSVVSFGAGPVSGWFASTEEAEPVRIVRRAVECGINWFDTAATYGEGRSEETLGRCLEEIGAADRVHVATKVRLNEAAYDDIRGFVLRSVEGSLRRLRRDAVTLLQLHNSVTARRGDQPTSVTPADVLDARGVLAAFEELRDAGVVRHLGFTGLGDVPSMRCVINSGRFETVQTPYNMLNPSAGCAVSNVSGDANYGDIFSHCRQQYMGAFAIRVFAGGALAGQEPSAHTKVTKFFPLDLYEQDRAQAAEVAARLPPGVALRQAAVRFALEHPVVTSALIGFGRESEIDEVVEWAAGATTGAGRAD